MESIIRKVIESEYRAQRIISEVEDARKQAELNIEKKIQKISNEISLSLEQKTERLKAEKKEQARVQAEQIISEANEKISIMENELKENRDAWVKCLLDNILGR